jgi:hypothetical protein
MNNSKKVSNHEENKERLERRKSGRVSLSVDWRENQGAR